eukprot:g357.t1
MFRGLFNTKYAAVKPVKRGLHWWGVHLIGAMLPAAIFYTTVIRPAQEEMEALRLQHESEEYASKNSLTGEKLDEGREVLSGSELYGAHARRRKEEREAESVGNSEVDGEKSGVLLLKFQELQKRVLELEKETKQLRALKDAGNKEKGQKTRDNNVIKKDEQK